MKKIIGLGVLVGVLVVGVCISSVFAVAPEYTITVQGKLTDSFGNSVRNTSVRGVRLYIYDALDNGMLIASKNLQNGITTDPNGVFNIEVAPSTFTIAQGQLFDFNKQYYLEIYVNDNTIGLEITFPRQKLTGAPYAIRAKYADVAASVVDAQGNPVGYVKKSGDMMNGFLIVSASSEKAISAESTNEIGVGVFGKGRASGGRFESTFGPRDMGVGIYGKGVAAGGSFESSAGYSGYFNGKVKIVGSLEVTNSVLLLPSNVPSAIAGKMYFDSTASRMRYYNGTKWIQIDPVFTDKPIVTTPVETYNKVGNFSQNMGASILNDAVLTLIGGRISHTGGSYSGSPAGTIVIKANGSQIASFPIGSDDDPFYLHLPVPAKIPGGTTLSVEYSNGRAQGAGGNGPGYRFNISLQYIELPL